MICSESVGGAGYMSVLQEGQEGQGVCRVGGEDHGRDQQYSGRVEDGDQAKIAHDT